MTPLEKVLEKFPDARKVGNEYVMCCRAHADTHASLWGRVGDDGRALLTCRSNQCPIEAIVASVGLEMRDLFPHDDPPPGRRKPPDKRRQVIELLRDTVADPGRLSAYFRSRGLAGAVPEALRFKAALPYFAEDGKKATATYPAMIASIRDVGGAVVGAHRTYLHPTEPGKAPEETTKKWMTTASGSTRGAAIRLFPATSRVALVEGIETGLAVHQATGTPVWVALSAGNLEVVELPPELREVQVWCDRDKSGVGQQAGERLVRRLAGEGRMVSLFVPPREGTDWLDVLVADGPEALLGAMPALLEVRAQTAAGPEYRQQQQRPTVQALPREQRQPELERAVLGTLLWSPRLHWDSGVDERDFQNGPMQAVAKVVQMLATSGAERADLTVLREQLRTQHKVEVTTEWLGTLLQSRIEDGFSAACKQLMDLTMRREGQAKARELLQALARPDADVREVLAVHTEGVLAVAKRQKEAEVVQASKIAEALWERLLRGEVIPRLNTGWQSVDHICRGLSPTDLVVLGGRTGTGKSSFLQQLCEQVARQSGKWSLLCTPEMDHEEVVQRSIARESKIELMHIVAGFEQKDRGKFRDHEIPRLSAGMWIYDDPLQTTRTIDAVARRLAAQGPLSIIGVDYLQFLANKPTKTESRQQLVGRMTRDLRRLAKALRVPVVAGAQLGREAEKKDVPQLRHLRESGDLEQDAVQVWFLYFPPGGAVDGGDVFVRVAKNRQGKTGTAKLRWNGALTKFEDPQDDEEPPPTSRFGVDL